VKEFHYTEILLCTPNHEFYNKEILMSFDTIRSKPKTFNVWIAV